MASPDIPSPSSSSSNHELLTAKGFSTIFGEIPEKNTTFVIDTSGSMYNCLEAVKEHLIETLLQRAMLDEQATMFNIVEFNTEVTQWADKMVRCTPQTVAVAASWIKNLQAKTGTNTQDALLTAFSDQGTEAVYLLTDGLPDQNTTDIVDHISYASQNRPIHCFYISGVSTDEAATEFLHDLSVETCGSFHILSVTNDGALEQVTPIYSNDEMHAHVIRSTEGNIYPHLRNHGVTTTLAASPEETLLFHHPLNSFYYPVGSSYIPVANYPVPYMAPNYAWSRYRPTKAWVRQTENVIDTANIAFSPAAGALLVGKQVLARRNKDGLYYLGSVKSQISTSKFLVEFGPCKHGRFSDRVYQETMVHDIISHADALRHSIITGDKVLAPTSSVAECYAPGTVIDGAEKRYADLSTGGPDKELTVTFYNGQSAQVTQNAAVWTPDALHRRIEFELQLPAKVRLEMSEGQQHYPDVNREGYPVSGPVRDPYEYETFQPVYVEKQAPFLQRGLYRHPHYIPLYPFQQLAPSSAYNSDELNKLIPGTEMTRADLSDKVSAQISHHHTLLEEKKEGSKDGTTEMSKEEKLLKRRENMEEQSLKKSVSFAENETERWESDLEDADGTSSLEKYDSGCDLDDLDLDQLDLEVKDTDYDTRDVAVGTDSKLFYRNHRPMKSQMRPPWKYWKNDPSPDIICPNAPGPFRETMLQAPLEARNQRVGKLGVEWANSHFGYVDPFAQSKRYPINESLRHPHPPNMDVEKQAPGVDISQHLGSLQTPQEQRELQRRDFRRRRIIQRNVDFDEKLMENERMKGLMQDQHRQRILKQIEREQQRNEKEYDMIQKAREAKKQLSTEIRSRIEQNQQHEAERQEARVDALRGRRERREQIQENREQEIQATVERRQAIKQQRAEHRWDSVNQKLADEEAQTAARDSQMRNAKSARFSHFRRMEEIAQKQKDLRLQVTDQQLAIYRSQVLP